MSRVAGRAALVPADGRSLEAKARNAKAAGAAALLVYGTALPAGALDADQAGRYLLVVNAENVVEQRKVTTGQLDGELRVIETGLKPDDKVVIGGLLRAIPGQKVDPQLKKIEVQPAAVK